MTTENARSRHAVEDVHFSQDGEYVVIRTNYDGAPTVIPVFISSSAGQGSTKVLGIQEPPTPADTLLLPS
jgi:hypothetical protein